MNTSVTVTSQDLIALRRAGEDLALPTVRVRARQAGGYVSRFRGRGMEFEESRPYQAGDDIRNIDWRVTARTGEAHTKVYREEKERPVLLAVDYRRAMRFATRGAFKHVVAARIAALLAWAGNSHGDRVGGLVFADSAHRELRPRRGKTGVLGFVRLLSEASQQVPGTPTDNATESLAAALGRLRRVARPGSLAFVISDFRGIDPRCESDLAQLARHNTVVLVFVFDPIETELPPAGIYRVRDGGHRLQLDTAAREVRRRYAARFAEHRLRLEQFCRRHALRLWTCASNAEPEDLVRQDRFFRRVA